MVLDSPCLEKSLVLLPAWLKRAGLSSVVSTSLPHWDICCLLQFPALAPPWCGCTWGLACVGAVSPPRTPSWRAGLLSWESRSNRCHQVPRKKWSNPSLGQVQGLRFLVALFSSSAACAAPRTFWESRSLLLMVSCGQ